MNTILILEVLIAIFYLVTVQVLIRRKVQSIQRIYDENLEFIRKTDCLTEGDQLKIAQLLESTNEGEHELRMKRAEIFRQILAETCTDYGLVVDWAGAISLFRPIGLDKDEILSRTGEFSERCARRMDDTQLVIQELIYNPFGSERFDLAIRRLNYLHGRHGKVVTDNAGQLYVLALFHTELKMVLERHGYRKLLDCEQQALLEFTIWFGVELGLKEIPLKSEQYFMYKECAEKMYMMYREHQEILAKQMFSDMCDASRVPRFLRSLMQEYFFAVFDDDKILNAIGIAPSSRLIKRIFALNSEVVKISKQYFLFPNVCIQRIPTSASPDGRYRTKVNPFGDQHPNGYLIQELGPPSVEKNGKLAPRNKFVQGSLGNDLKAPIIEKTL